MTISITPISIIESTIMYGIVHAIWVGISYIYKRSAAQARKERNRIIKRHVKTGHQARLKQCVDEQCASLRSSAHQRLEALALTQVDPES